MITKQTGFIIFGSNGCTCCRDKNFVQGFFKTEVDAKATVEHHRRHKMVSSQCSLMGDYVVKPVEYELISDGRVIINDRVLDNDIFMLLNQNEQFLNFLEVQ